MQEKYLIKKEEAIKNIKVADHILNMTYPLVKDPKLLKLVLNNIYKALYNTIAMLLYYERYYKKIPAFSENYDAMVEVCKDVFKRYNVSKGYIGFLHQIKEMLDIQKNSEIEFVRKEKIFFSSNNYDLKKLTIEEIKDYNEKAKLFINDIMRLIK